MSDKNKSSVEPQNLLVDVYASLARGVDWIVRAAGGDKSRYHLYDDLDGICARISGLYTVVDNKLHMFRIDMCEDLDTPCKKAEWLDKRIRPFSKDLSRFISRYLENLVSEKILPPYVLRDLEPVFASCAGCTLRFRCLYVFKEVLSILDPSIIFSSSKDTLLYDVYRSNSENLKKVIDGLLIKKDDIAGWPCATTHKEEIDVYVTASILNSLLLWQNHIEELHLRHDFSAESSLFGLCIESIYKLQEKEKVERSRELIGDTIDVNGSWKEFYWGEYLVNRIKATASIAKMLYKLRGKVDAVKRAKTFVDRTFGNAPYCIDLVSYRDTICSTVSDISGTVSALEMYLTLGKDFGIDARDINTLAKVRWLLDQQRREGAWPILSNKLFNEYQGTQYIRDTLRESDAYEKRNISLPNTVGAMKALATFLKAYLKQE
ncbi:MAG: hypothetical protein WBW16_09630 [Bacteroidota bacterium]